MTIQQETNYRVTCDHVFRWIEFDENGPRFADLDPNAGVRERPCEVSHLHRGEDLDAAEKAYLADGWRRGPASDRQWFCPAHAPVDDESDALKGHPLQGLAAGLSRAADSQR